MHLSEEEWEQGAETLGISAIKYFEFNRDRKSQYVFDFDKVLDPRGNTGVYLIYQYVRICSIFTKAGSSPEQIEAAIADGKVFTVTHPTERNLAITLLKLPEQVDAASDELQMLRLTELLYDVSTKIGAFYAACRVVGSEEQESRLILLEAARKVMKQIFDLLGMKVLQRI